MSLKVDSKLAFSAELRAAFDEAYYSLRDVVKGLFEADAKTALERTLKMMDINLINGKYFRGLSVVSTYLAVAANSDVEKRKELEAGLEDVYLLGWVVEMLQSASLMMDDIVDQAETRRGRLCWYKTPGIGMHAVNDGLQLIALVFDVLCRHFISKPYGKNALHLFAEKFQQTSMGESMDLTMEGGGIFSDYTTEIEAIAQYKNGYYTCPFPVRLGLYAAGLDDAQLHADAGAIALEIGVYYQFQDDFLDCYVDPASTGKIGTDIVDGKVTWLVMEARKLVNAEQLKRLRDNYGIKTKEAEAAVKAVYDEIGIKERYLAWDRATVANMLQTVKDVSERHPVLKSVFETLIATLFGREK